MDIEKNDVPEVVEAQDDEISLLDVAIVLAKHKKKIAGLAAAASVAALAISLLMPNIYTATAKILPPQQAQSSASAMLAQLGGLAGLAGGAAGLKSPNDLYLGMLKSRPVADNLVQRYSLMQRYESKLQSSARQVLASKSNLSAGKDGIIVIDVEDTDPKVAADLANAYVDELYKLTRVLAVTEASQRRLFFERQLNQAKENLTHAQLSAKAAMDQGGLVNVDVQGRAVLETNARLRGQISAKEVQIAAMRAYAADRNPELLKAQQELAAMKAELAKTEGAGRGATQADNSGQGLESLRQLRDLKYYETVYEMLAKQYELAKIDEAKDSSVIQVLEKAIEPDRKSKPKRSLIVLLAAFGGLFVGMLWAFGAEMLERARKNPDTETRLNILRASLRWRSPT